MLLRNSRHPWREHGIGASVKPDTILMLVGPSGDKERWRICYRPLKKGHFGDTDWVKRVVIINSRLRNPTSIRDTILHEIQHVTMGQNGSEELAINVERNYRQTIKSLGLE